MARAAVTSAPRAATPPVPPRGAFLRLCLGGYLLSVGYGVTFLLALLVAGRGGDAAAAGRIIASATIGTVVLVVLSGHVADMLGTVRAIVAAALVIALGLAGFALAPGIGWPIYAAAVTLGAGWGLFYTLGPILVAATVDPVRRTHSFALLSGSMMSGIGTGPLAGRLAAAVGLPVEAAFVAALVACLLGAAIYAGLDRALRSDRIAPPNRLDMASARSVLRSPAVLPIVMVGLGGAVFGGLSSFQTNYAAARGLDYALFFFGFVAAVVIGRLLLSGIVLRREPHATSLALTALTALAVVLFATVEPGPAGYLAIAMVLGAGYGLTYSVINGLAAAEAPAGHVPQALLLFSLSYFVGVFGFPLVAGYLISGYGLRVMLLATLGVAVINTAIPLVRVLDRDSPRT